jgi:hypothetical protein
MKMYQIFRRNFFSGDDFYPVSEERRKKLTPENDSKAEDIC